jgi:hypothetical protein
MSNSTLTEFNLPQNAYASFDAQSMKAFMLQRLRNSGQFTDQFFEGSNLSSLIDILAYSYHTLLFYLNKQSAESYFSQAEIYENMNKIVNLIGYKPTGPQTSIVSMSAVASPDLSMGNYALRQFSFINSGGTIYSIANDIFFEKTSAAAETIDSIGSQSLLYQGQFAEYDALFAIGQPFETFTIVDENTDAQPTQERFIDNNNIFVYVKENTDGKWYQYLETSSLYLSQANTRAFERRFNENGRYEIKFGDGIFGRQLLANEEIAIYYLVSNGRNGIIESNTLQGNFVQLNTSKLRTINADTTSVDSNYLTPEQLAYLTIINTAQSTQPKLMESVQDIRTNAPRLFASQNRIVTTNDFDLFVTKNFSNIIISSKTVNNKLYVEEYVKYFYDIGLNQPNDDAGILLNQVNFYDACDFNNVYCFVVPNLYLLNNAEPQLLSASLKQLMINQLGNQSLANVEVIPSDPVYRAYAVATAPPGETLSTDLLAQSSLVITRDAALKTSTNQIKSAVKNAIVDFFASSNNALGQSINLTQLSLTLLNIGGVSAVNTVRTVDGIEISTPGISFLTWNPLYPSNDVALQTQNKQLQYFMYPYLYQPELLDSQIKVIDAA